MALSEQLEDSRDKVDVWNELAYKHRGNRDNEAARVLAKDAIELAVRLRYLEGEASACNILGNLAKSEADYPEAGRLFEKALALRLKDGNKEDAASCHSLTERELIVLQLLANGLTAKEVSIQLEIEETTARTHIRNLRGKFEVTNVMQLVTAALKKGLARLA